MTHMVLECLETKSEKNCMW